MKNSLVFLLLLLLGFSCGQAKESYVTDTTSIAAVAPEVPGFQNEDIKSEELVKFARQDLPRQEDKGGNGNTGTGNPGNNNTPDNKDKEENKGPVEKKIIKNAQLTVRVEDYKGMDNSVKSLLSRYKGYISSSTESNTGYGLQREVLLRLPAAHFDAMMDELLKLASYIELNTVTSQDVTEEFVDLQARLRTKKQVEQRYVEILKNARSIEEILKVENEIRVIREEIEAKEGRMRYLSDQVSYSSIVLRYSNSKQEYVKPPEETFWGRLANAFGNGWDGILHFVLLMANLWPVLIVVVLGVMGIRRWRKSRRP